MAYATQLARLHHLMGKCHGRATPIVEPDKRLDLGGLCSLDHFPSVGQRAGDRLFARDRFARGNRRTGDRGMHVVGRHHVDQPDLRGANQLLPVGRSIFPTPVVGEGSGVLLRLPKHSMHHRNQRGLEELGDLAPGVGMCPSHEALPNQGDIDRGHAMLLK